MVSRDSRPITKWSVLALVCVVIGAATTMTLDQIWLNEWVKSGSHFPINQWNVAELPLGSTLVYYESPYSVPIGDVSLHLTDPEGERIRMAQLTEDISYRVFLSGWSGRALWRINLTKPGNYRFRCSNSNFADDSQVPLEDRITFAKTPASLADATRVRKFVQITGATLTMTLVIVFYLLHALALKRRKLAETAEPTSV
jgi:hypothetical protein